MPLDAIVVKGACEHNLKNIDVEIPRDRLVVITGVSGSGKSSLAFDTISPAISIDQKGPSRNPRSTMGTVTETYDYLRLLFARVGHPHCPKCGREIASQTVQQIVDAIQALPPNSRIMVLAPLVKDRKGEYQAVFDDLRQAGYIRVRVDGHIHDLSEEFQLDKNKKHSIEVVVDRLIIGQSGSQSRIADSVETALKLGAGVVLVSIVDGEELLFSEHFACVYCGISLGEIAPRTFSFNSPHGACPACTGLGVKLEVDPELIISNKELSIAQGAIHPGWWFSWHAHELEILGRRYGFAVHTPVKDLGEHHLKLVLYGEEGEWVRYRSRFGRVREHFTGYEGVIPYLERLGQDTQSERTRAEIERYLKHWSGYLLLVAMVTRLSLPSVSR